MKQDPTERAFIFLVIAILVLTYAHDRDIRLLDARVTNIEEAK